MNFRQLRRARCGTPSFRQVKDGGTCEEHEPEGLALLDPSCLSLAGGSSPEQIEAWRDSQPSEPEMKAACLGPF